MSECHVIPLLIECGFRASLPVCIAWAATRLLASRSSAASRHFVWACAIAIALLLPFARIVTPRWSVANPAPIARLTSAARIKVAPPTISNVAATERIATDAADKPKDRRPIGFTPCAIATWIWITGAFVVFCYALIGHFAAWRLYRTTRRIQDCWIQDTEQLAREAGLSGPLRVVESSTISAPVVLHLWRPVIVMPETAGRWSRARIRAVLLHEFAHIKRNDLHVQSLAQFACALYWFNPLVWLAAQQLRLERERACDDFVLLGGTSGADYATHLFEIARGGSASIAAPFAIGLAEYRSQLEQRLVAVVNPRTPRHSATILGRFIVALPMLLVSLAAGAVQITARAIEVPVGAVNIPVSAVHARAVASELLTGGNPAKARSVPTEASAEGHSQPEEFHWAARMHEPQTIEVRLGCGSIQVLRSTDHSVRVQARTDKPRHSEIRAVATSSGVKFCNIITTPRESRNYCEPGQDTTSRIQEDQPVTEFVIYVPAGLHFTGSTILGDITAERPSADNDMATIDGNITLLVAPEEGANFNGNVIEGEIDSDFPLNDNTPTLPTGKRPAINAPRIVHAIVGSGGPRLSAMVVNGNIRLLRRSAE
jgi:beta-lactamase regulating signal transducer with metallopeptidase domain